MRWERLAEARAFISRWGGKGVASLLDQASFAVSHFLLNVLMARWLTPEAYGSFVVAHTLFLLAATAHAGLLIEPLLVFGSSRYLEERSSYLGAVLRLHWLYGGAAFVLFLLAAAVARAAGAVLLTGPLLAVAVAAPAMMLLWLARKACYLWLEPRWAVEVGLIYLLLLVPAAWALHVLGHLGPASAILLMGAASLVAGGRLLRGRGAVRAASPAPGRWRQALREHWDYGRWSASTRLLNWLPHSIYFLALPFWVGIEASGSLKALLNLLNPLIHTYTAVAVLLMTVLVRLRDGPRFDRTMRWSALLLVGAAVAFWAALGLFGEPLVSFLYGGKYVAEAKLLWILGAVPLVNGLAALSAAALRALEAPDKVFYAYAAATAVALGIGLPLMTSLGLAGAALGLVASGAAAATVATVLLGRLRATVWILRRETPRGTLASPQVREP